MPQATCHFLKATRIPTSADALFAWHEEPEAFTRLTPPWEAVQVLVQEGGIRDGARVVLKVGTRPFALRWELTHEDYRPGRSFTDRQVRGPFRLWRHEHRMRPDGPDACVLEDAIEFAFPLGWLGNLVGEPFMRRKLERMFAYRHAETLAAFSKKTTL